MDTPVPPQPQTPQPQNQSGPAAPSQQGIAAKITHSRPGIGPMGAPASVPPPDPTLSLSGATAPAAPAAPKITAFGKERRHEESWSRTPNTTGSGAIHVKTFHCKLTEDALTYMDQLINEWLDAHPQYEVKFVHSTIGTFTGKLKEPALICQVWV